MDFRRKFKLFCFLSLCLLSEARHLQRREVETSSETEVGNLEALRSPQKYIIEPVQTLTKVSNNALTPPYDAVDFGFDDKLNEIESKNEEKNYELVKALELLSSKGNNDKSTQTATDFEIEIEALQLKEALNEENLNQTKNQEIQLALLKNFENKDETRAKTTNQENQNQNDFIKVKINTDSENNLKNLKASSMKNIKDEPLITEMNISDKKEEAETTDLQQNVHTEETPLKVKENSENVIQIISDISDDQDKETWNSDKISPLKMDPEKESLIFEQQISTQENNSNDKEKEASNSESLNSIKESEQQIPLLENNSNNNNEVKFATVAAEDNIHLEEEKDKVTESMNTENNNETYYSETSTSASATTDALNSEKVMENSSTNSLEKSDKNPNLEEISHIKVDENLKPYENSHKINENEVKISETTIIISTTEKTQIETITTDVNKDSINHPIETVSTDVNKETLNHTNIEAATETTTTDSKEITESTLAETSSNANKDVPVSTEADLKETTSTETPLSASKNSTKQPNIPVATEVTMTTAKGPQNNQTDSVSVRETLTSPVTNPSTSEPITESKPISTTQPKPTDKPANISKSPEVTTITSAIKPLTQSSIQSTTKSSVSLVTRRPTRPSRFPIRRPIRTRRPSTTRRPFGWFPNFPLLPLNAPPLPTFFINRFNDTTILTTNQTQSTFGFGLFAIPWNRRPNFGNFFGPNRIIETRPLLNDAPTPPAESRDLAFWNALFHRGNTKDPEIIKQTEGKPDETKQENATHSYWKPWKYLTRLKFLKFPKFFKNTEQATIPANTQVLHFYFPLKYPFLGQIVQTPAKQLNDDDDDDDVFNAKVNEKVETVPMARKSVIEVKDALKTSVKETTRDVVKEVIKDDSVRIGNDDNDKNVNFTVKGKREGSLMFEVELPKPMVNFIKGVMDTFRPQQN